MNVLLVFESRVILDVLDVIEVLFAATVVIWAHVVVVDSVKLPVVDIVLVPAVDEV